MTHFIDRIGAAVVSRGPRRLRFFTDGWGGSEHLTDLSLPSDPPHPVSIEWVHEWSDNGLATSVGLFESPLADSLPPRSRFAAVTRVAPGRPTRRTVVLMAAWNEHDSKARFDIARRLAEHGITSLVVENPYYGVRRPRDGQPIRTVADFATMGSAAIAEGRALLATIHHNGETAGISGYSMGGNVAALISATMPFPVASAPLAAAHSPAPVYLDGALRGGIDWEALGGEASAAPALRRMMLEASVRAVPAAEHTRHAVIVAATADGYVPRESTEMLHRHWPGSELRWVAGGHATLLWFRKQLLADAIVDAFDRIEAAG
ncbi:MAG: hypothetical protein BMS9Abin07_0774 [Acidimicrobiia bacterium]|nr:MAG: hypothetical protein BMS9Abin07_0774 [Acidimicrobiia bacterium]